MGVGCKWGDGWWVVGFWVTLGGVGVEEMRHFNGAAV